MNAVTRRRTVAVAVGAAVILIGVLVIALVKLRQSPATGFTQQVGSFVLTLEGHPEAASDIDQNTAISTALATMTAQDAENGAPGATGYRVTSAYHAFGLVRATTRDGKEVASWREPKDVWVLEFAAPPQQGWAHVRAFAIIDAPTGKVESFSETKTN